MAKQQPWWRRNEKVREILFKGDNKHVFLGVVGVLGIAAIPWYFMNLGVKHDSHADYMDRAEQARKGRLTVTENVAG